MRQMDINKTIIMNFDEGSIERGLQFYFELLEYLINNSIQYHFCQMQPSNDIPIDLPKLTTRPLSILHKKLQKITPFHVPLKQPAKCSDDPLRKLMQRYKTQLYDSHNTKCDNQFMEFASENNRSNHDQAIPKKKSFSFIHTERSIQQSSTLRDHSVQFRKRRLPKLIAIKNVKEQQQEKGNGRQQIQRKNSLENKMGLITFYPHKMKNNQSQPQ